MTRDLRYTRRHDLDELRPAWGRLCAGLRDAAFFHRWGWHRAIRDHLFDDVTYHCFFEREELVAVFPLHDAGMGPSGLPLRVLRMPTHQELFLGDAVIDDRYCESQWIDALLSKVVTEGGERPDTICFHRVRSRSCVTRNVPDSGRRVRYQHVGGSAYCGVGSPHSLTTLSAKHLRGVDRLHRRAVREAGSVEHVSMTDCAAYEEGMATFMSVEASGWKGPRGEGTSVSCVPQAAAFYRGVLANFSESDDARVDVLLIGGVPAAAHLAVRCGSTWSILKVGFDEAFARYGPGNILLKFFIEAMTRNPDVTEVSLVTAPPWADRWHMRTEPTYDVTVFAGSPLGQVMAVGHHAMNAVRRLKARVRSRR